MACNNYCKAVLCLLAYQEPKDFRDNGKTIAAFMNSDGGNLFIGVDDNSVVLGLDDDLNTFNEDKRSLDGFELQLIQIIKKYIGTELSSYIKISFPKLDENDFCHVKISKSSRPVFTKFEDREDFFIRSGCSSQPLDRASQSTYEKERWG